MTTPELKPCPFCGGGASYSETHDNLTHFQLVCGNYNRVDRCPLKVVMSRDVPHSMADEVRASIVNAWNTRAPQPQSGDRAKALDALQHLEDSLDGYGAKYEIETIRAALTQPEFEVVDVDSVDPIIDRSAARHLMAAGYQIVRKKGGE